MPSRTLVSLAVLLAIQVTIVAGSSSSSSGENYDLSKKIELRKLYNSKVFVAERMQRPLDGMSSFGALSHSGVRVTLADGSQWLVHKGDNFGKDSDTIVVDARHMSNKWKIIETKDFKATKTVFDFVKAGGTDYSLIFDNCHDGAGRMMDQ